MALPPSPVVSRLAINGIRYDEFGTYFPEVETLDPEAIGAAVVKSAYDVLNGKGWTNAGVAQSAITLAQAVLLDEKSVHPVCTILRGQYGHDGDVALSIALPDRSQWRGKTIRGRFG